MVRLAVDSHTGEVAPRRWSNAIHASFGFYLCTKPHTGQRNGTATEGRVRNTTHWVFRPVETAVRVRGHLTKISPGGSVTFVIRQS
jgi:hypothetical protein